jgi:hypothetical protein
VAPSARAKKLSHERDLSLLPRDLAVMAFWPFLALKYSR